MKQVKLIIVSSLLLCLLALASCSKGNELGPEYTDPTYGSMECISLESDPNNDNNYIYTYLDTDYKKHSFSGYDDIDSFYQDSAIAKKRINGTLQYGVIDSTGKELVKFGTYTYFDHIFLTPYYIVSKDDKTYGVINSKGETIIECKYSSIEDSLYSGTAARRVCYFNCKKDDGSYDVLNESGKPLLTLTTPNSLKRYYNDLAPLENAILQYDADNTTIYVSEKSAKTLIKSTDYETIEATYCALYYKGKNGQQGIFFYNEDGEQIKNISVPSNEHVSDFLSIGNYIVCATYNGTTIYDSNGKVVKAINGHKIDGIIDSTTNECYIISLDDNDTLTVYNDSFKEQFKLENIDRYSINLQYIEVTLNDNDVSSVYDLKGNCVVPECKFSQEDTGALVVFMTDDSKKYIISPSGITLADGEEIKYPLYNSYVLVEGDSYYRVINPEGKETFKFDQEKLIESSYSISPDIKDIPILELSDGWFTYEGKKVADADE